ncbi:MAG: hypothetical protein R3250_02740 [Melioribacteraceae bacterium]|nr:hypothetical protein [Melioribacteraceae bacterium]
MTKLDWKIKKIEFLQWWINTPVYWFFYVRLATIFTTAYMLIRYRFDFDRINAIIDRDHKEMRYQHRKETERRVALVQKLNQINRLNREIGEKLNEKDNGKRI